MTIEAYYGLALLFVAGVAVTAFLAVQSASALRFVAPFAVASSIAVGYWGIDALLGVAHPVGYPPGWSRPVFGQQGAVVLGGKVDGPQVYLLLDDQVADAPRLFDFGSDPATKRALKQAMEAHAKATGGNQWGFRVTVAGDGVDGAGEAGKGPGNGSAPPGDKSLENRQPRFRFGDPQPKHYPDKPAQPGAVTVPAQP